MTDEKLIFPAETHGSITTEESNAKDLLTENQYLKEENETLRCEVRFWHLFYSESVRLFGEKRDRFENVIKKSMRHIGAECRIKAALSKGMGSDKKGNLEQSPSGGFDVEGFMKDCDEQAKNDYQKKTPRIIVTEYHGLINDPGEVGGLLGFSPKMDKKEAIELLMEKYSFGSYSACYQCLKDYGVKGLPFFSE